MGNRRIAILLSAAIPAVAIAFARAGETTQPDAGVAAALDAGVRQADAGDGVRIAGERTTVLRVEERVGRPIEREPAFLRMAPTYGRAIEMDRDQRWAEAAGLYQQALIEIGAAIKFAPTPLLEQAAFKIDLERRRSRTLAQVYGADPTGAHAAGAPRVAHAPASTSTSAPTPMPALDRGRLLRQKLMAVRAVTGSIPAGLASATLGALGQALRQPDAGNAESARANRPRAGGGDPEIRLLLCAARAAAGDRTGARIEQAHVSRSERFNPTRALAFAVCQAALGYDDQALAALAVVLHRLGPSPRFLPGQSRELQSANDWDTLRADPRFDRLFR